MATSLPPPPTSDAYGSYAWLEWFRQLRAYITVTGSIPWSIINFAGSNITDIAARSHQSLQSLQGGTTGEYYHLTSGEYAGSSQSNIDAAKLLGNTWAIPEAIGATTPAAGTFTTLTATGNTVLGDSTSDTTKVSGNLILPKTSGYGIQVDTGTPTFGWRDIIGRITPKATGAGSPSRGVYSGGTIGQYKFVANDVVDCEFHIPHDYVPGTDIYIHVHWSHNGTAISGNVVFDFYHTYAKGHNQENFPAEKTVSITYNTTDITTTPQYRHRVDEVIMSGESATATLMDRDLLEPDGLVLITMKLNTLPTITAGDLFVHFIDIHYQSTQLGTKNKSPNFYS